METHEVIGAPVQGKPGFFHPGTGDQAFKQINGSMGLNDGSTHRTTPDKAGKTQLYVKVAGLWQAVEG